MDYRAEEIEGFFVTEMMKRFWAAGVEGLLEIDRICKKHNIRYFLYYGTLLGAVRHKGFIPWDDDIDIVMLRKDYNKFLSIVESELELPFYIDNVAHESCFYTSCIHNTHYPSIEPEFMQRFHGCPYAMAIDIFPFDNVPDDKEKLHEFTEIHKIVKYLSQRTDPAWYDETLPEFVRADRDYPSWEELQEAIDGVEQYLNIRIDRGERLSRDLALIADELAQRYNDSNCKYVAYVHSMDLSLSNKGYVPKSIFDDVVDYEFQGFKFPGPKDYEYVLENQYGKNWKVPVQGASAHNYPSYGPQAAQLKYIFEAYGASAPNYFYL